MVFAANFAVPVEEPAEEGEAPLYSEIIFAELDREEATKLVEEYRKVGQMFLEGHLKNSPKMAEVFPEKSLLPEQHFKKILEKYTMVCRGRGPSKSFLSPNLGLGMISLQPFLFSQVTNPYFKCWLFCPLFLFYDLSTLRGFFISTSRRLPMPLGLHKF